MRIFDRYVLREFAGYLALGLAGFIVIFVVVDIFEKIDVFLDHKAPFLLVARFYLFRAPEVVVQVLPVALLLASFLGL
ncbi:MAG TPA: LptF/LptG family permease, partial [Candidatus Eisenbacteria bacterium]